MVVVFPVLLFLLTVYLNLPCRHNRKRKLDLMAGKAASEAEAQRAQEYVAVSSRKEASPFYSVTVPSHIEAAPSHKETLLTNTRTPPSSVEAFPLNNSEGPPNVVKVSSRTRSATKDRVDKLVVVQTSRGPVTVLVGSVPSQGDLVSGPDQIHTSDSIQMGPALLSDGPELPLIVPELPLGVPELPQRLPSLRKKLLVTRTGSLPTSKVSPITRTGSMPSRRKQTTYRFHPDLIQIV